ncbi:uncharacterized protein LOC110532594 isoform X8 [Oncorhynchus mykiss]|uniref:uncharacterized protein LOC110532594 isoform X8 n=1 Tax=Oncorhynchus mykiss TaxID=8022 RepID=UPI00187810BA|nr:uncharacterized protein LOC110532594 isoform X8 [Oncorhynchus mykiss]
MKSLTSVIKDLYRIGRNCLSSYCTVLSRLCHAHAQMVALEMSKRFSISHNINNKAHHSKDLFTFLLEEDHVRSLPSMAAQTENGFLHLKQYLKEMSSMRQALNTGRPLVICLRDQDRLPPIPKKTSPRSTNDKIAADIECTMSIKQHAPAEEEILRRIKFRRDEHIIEKLQWIYKILCGLTNMRNRDLKTLSQNHPPLSLLATYEKDPQKPKNRHDMLERVRTKFIEIQRSMNNQMETDMFEKKIHREERMRTLLDALMASRKETSLPMLLSSLKHELREPKSALLFWYEILKSDVSELSDDRDFEYRTILQKIGQFHNFSHKKLPYSKLLQPAMQDALMFLTENVFQLLPRQLKHWYQYLKLPFYDAS